MLVTRPTHRGSGIALLVETSNAEAHADMYINEYDANNRQGLPAQFENLGELVKIPIFVG